MAVILFNIEAIASIKELRQLQAKLGELNSQLACKTHMLSLDEKTSDSLITHADKVAFQEHCARVKKIEALSQEETLYIHTLSQHARSRPNVDQFIASAKETGIRLNGLGFESNLGDVNTQFETLVTTQQRLSLAEEAFPLVREQLTQLRAQELHYDAELRAQIATLEKSKKETSLKISKIHSRFNEGEHYLFALKKMLRKLKEEGHQLIGFTSHSKISTPNFLERLNIDYACDVDQTISSDRVIIAGVHALIQIEHQNHSEAWFFHPNQDATKKTVVGIVYDLSMDQDDSFVLSKQMHQEFVSLTDALNSINESQKSTHQQIQLSDSLKTKIKTYFQLTASLGGMVSFITCYFLTPMVLAQPSWIGAVAFMFLGGGVAALGFVLLTAFVFGVIYCCASRSKTSGDYTAIELDEVPMVQEEKYSESEVERAHDTSALSAHLWRSSHASAAIQLSDSNINKCFNHPLLITPASEESWTESKEEFTQRKMGELRTNTAKKPFPIPTVSVEAPAPQPMITSAHPVDSVHDSKRPDESDDASSSSDDSDTEDQENESTPNPAPATTIEGTTLNGP